VPSPRSDPGTAPEPPVSDPAVSVRDLVIRYGDLVAVDRLSFEARTGEVTVVLGPNGAGKTSTIEHLEGYRRATSGSSRVLGLDPTTDHAALTRRVGVMLQSGGVQTAIRPRELLRQYAGFFPDPLPVEDLLDRVRLRERAGTPYRRLSGGERQRLSLALALVGRPEVVFLDEPTSGVDLDGREAIRSLVYELRAEGCCVVLTTHDLDEAERLADHVVIIDGGRVVADGRPEDLVRADDGDHLLFRAPAGLDTHSLGAWVGGRAAEVGPGEYRVDLPPSPANVAAVTAWLAEHDLALGDLRAGRQRLDDVFRRLTAGDDSARSAGRTPGKESS
jgi:ABC-2 type transport system ATP-binding protein